MSETKAKEAVLHTRHQELGGLMTRFGCWDMPLWYKAGAVKEHLAVISACGLFDTSHMDVIFVEGKDRRLVLNKAFSRDLTLSKSGRALYGVFLRDNGYCLDDAVFYPLSGGRDAFVVNAGMGAILQAHLASLGESCDIVVREANPRLAKLDIQGPASPRLAQALLAKPSVLDSFPYFSFQGDFETARSELFLADGSPVLVSRSGYTGEVGFELFLPLERAVAVWDAILEQGAGHGLLPCGLAARDSLRVGAVLPLSHQDIGDWPFINNPWTFALPLMADGRFSKNFLGAEALNPATAEHTLPFVGFDQRRVDPADAAVVFQGENIGAVTSIVSDMALGRTEGGICSLTSPDLPEGWKPRGLCCGFVKTAKRLDAGEIVVLRDKRREIEVEIADDIRPNRTARRKLGEFLAGEKA